MKRLALLGVLVLSFAAAAVADVITFSFVIGPPGSLTASAGGLSAGPAANVLVSDTTTGVSFPLSGTFTGSAGPATSFSVFPGIVLATYSAGGPNSVLIVNPASMPLVAGTVLNNAVFITTFPTGAGAFLATFNVTFVDPAVLALFGLGQGFLPVGSASLTFAGDNFDGTTVTGAIGGGTVTIQTTPIPEPMGLGVLGMGLLAAAEGLRRMRGSLRA